MTTAGVRCAIMRGGSSKGAYFLAEDLPADTAARDDLLLRLMGSPDPRQIDGLGGAHPLTSKVAVVAPSSRPDADIDYLFLQVSVDEALVSDRQNCGNLLAGVGPFAIERQLIEIDPKATQATVGIYMANTDSVATATFPIGDGRPIYDGDTAISGVPGTSARIDLVFADVAGGSTGALLPTGSTVDVIDGVDCTLIDNGMPTVVMAAQAIGISGYEDCATLEANAELRKRLEAIRLQAGPLMNLGEVTDSTVPKLTMVAPPRAGGHLSTRTFIPHRCHDAIGVLGAVSVATAALLDDSPAARCLAPLSGDVITLEHPTGSFAATIGLRRDATGVHVERAGIVRTARLLMDGVAFPRPE